MDCSAQQAKKLPGRSEWLASAHICCYWQKPSLYTVLLPPFSSLHLLSQVNLLQSETHQPLPLFPFSQSLSFDPGCTHILPSFIPSPSFEHPSIPHLLSCSSCSFYTNWLSTPSTATYTGFLPDHSYPSVPHFPFLLFPPLSLLMPSCGVTGLMATLGHGAWACVTVPQLPLHSHCGCNAIITPHDGQGMGRER